MKTANGNLSRRGFLAAALAASLVKTTEAKANTTSLTPMPKMPSGLARGDEQSTMSGREGLKTYVTPYFDGGWTMYMFADRGNNVMLSTMFKSPSGKVVMIDGGWPKDADFLVPALKELGGTVDAWFLTHAHSDHYGA